MIDSYLTQEMQRLLQSLTALMRASTARERVCRRLHVARTANNYSADEVLTAR
jgi:hypothetical protein